MSATTPNPTSCNVNEQAQKSTLKKLLDELFNFSDQIWIIVNSL